MPSSPCAHLQSTANTIRCLVPTILNPQNLVICLNNFCVILDSCREVDEICCMFSSRVIPRRLNFICRRFGTLYLSHLHRQVDK
jgi:hypothetical protein